MTPFIVLSGFFHRINSDAAFSPADMRTRGRKDDNLRWNSYDHAEVRIEFNDRVFEEPFVIDAKEKHAQFIENRKQSSTPQEIIENDGTLNAISTPGHPM